MSPTYEITDSFGRDWRQLDDASRKRFKAAKDKFVADLKKGEVRSGLRIKAVQGTEQVWEFTYSPDGRATFQYGAEIPAGEPHIIWRRVGTHEVLDTP